MARSRCSRVCAALIWQRRRAALTRRSQWLVDHYRERSVRKCSSRAASAWRTSSSTLNRPSSVMPTAPDRTIKRNGVVSHSVKPKPSSIFLNIASRCAVRRRSSIWYCSASSAARFGSLISDCNSAMASRGLGDRYILSITRREGSPTPTLSNTSAISARRNASLACARLSLRALLPAMLPTKTIKNAKP